LHVLGVTVVVLLLLFALAVQWLWQGSSERQPDAALVSEAPTTASKLLAIKRDKLNGASTANALPEPQTLVVDLSSDDPAPPTDQQDAVDALQLREDSVDYNFAERPDQLNSTQPAGAVQPGAEELVMRSVTRSASTPTARPTPMPMPTPAPVAQSRNPPPTQFTQEESWLLSLNPEHFTLQLLGVRDEQAARDFLVGYPELEDLVFFKTLYRGKDWYVVVYGDFATRQAAATAVTQLPASLRDAKPWTRQLQQIQQEINR
jgi:DamX protein